jgi:succinate dehydrogenase / fumarate reductase flavoprotein subunit
MIYPAVHYTMGTWVDYNLQTTISWMFFLEEVISLITETRLGASALMQGLADGYFVLPYTIGDYLAPDIKTGEISTDLPEFVEAENNVKARIERFITNNGTHSVDYFHKKLGKIMWNKVGMARNAQGLTSNRRNCCVKRRVL